MKKKLLREQWSELKTAYASGLGLRELARNMGVAEGTILSRAKREGWSKQITEAKGIALKMQSNAITPMQSAVSSLQERGESYKDSMRLLIEKKVRQLLLSGLPAIESMSDAERFNKIARETYGLNLPETQINVQTNVLASLM